MKASDSSSNCILKLYNNSKKPHQINSQDRITLKLGLRVFLSLRNMDLGKKKTKNLKHEG